MVGLKDYPRGAQVTPENAIMLDEKYGTLEICYGQELTKLSRKQDKLALNGWLPVMVIRADDNAVRYEFTYWATPMSDVKDWKKAFDESTEGENFLVWVKYRVSNGSNHPSKGQVEIRKTSDSTYVNKLYIGELAPGASVEGAACYPFFPVENTDQLKPGDYKIWLDRTVDYWKGMMKTIASIEVPCAKSNEALNAAHICQLIAKDLGEVRGGEGFYDEFYIRDGAYLVMELEEAGMWEAVKKSIEMFLPRQRPDGRFESQKGQLDANGQALWVFWNYYQMSADRRFLERVYPMMKRASEWTLGALKETVNDPEFPGLLPPALADGEFLWKGKNHIVGYDFWNLRGILCTADAAKALGRKSDAEALTKAADQYRQSIEKAMQKNGLSYFPPNWELDGTHWGNTETLWPTGIFPKSDPRVSRLIDYLRKDFGGGYVEETIRWIGCSDAMGAYTTMADLILGNDEQVVQDFYWYLLHSTAAHAFPEGILYKTNTAWSNTIPHVTGACNYAIMLRHMLVHEEGDELHLLKADPDWWLGPGQKIRVERLPTHFGNIDLLIKGTTNGVEVSLKGPDRNKRAKIIIHLPENRPLVNNPKGITVQKRKPQKAKWDFETIVNKYLN